MQFVELSSIIIPADRQRQEFEPESLVELMNSIQEIGLLQPIITRASADGPVLVAGERRIRAIKDIWALGGWFTFEEQDCYGEGVKKEGAFEGAIPTVDLGDLTDFQAATAEFDENDKRANISWQERAAATARLAKLRTLRATAAGLPAPTVGEIAVEVRGDTEGRHLDDTRREIIVARHFKDPEVAGAKSLDEAWKTLKRREETEKRVALAARVGATFTAAAHKLYHADSQLWLADCPSETFDCILTDPPFGMGADEFGDAGQSAMPHAYEDSASVMEAILTWLPASLTQATKPQAHLYWFCDVEWFGQIGFELEIRGWEVHRTPLIWHKPNGFRAPWPEYGPQRKYELILYAVKGKRPCLKLAGDVIQCSLEPGAVGAQKPVALFAELLSRTCRPGDSVLDPFAGSGPLAPAAHGLKVAATLIEKDASQYALAMQRLEKLK